MEQAVAQVDLPEGIGAHEETPKKKKQSPDEGRHASTHHA